MEIISNPTQVEIKKAAQALKDGHLVAFPTETVYGLGADATNQNAVSRVYSVKGRPTDHPLIVHISSIDQLGEWAVDIPEYAVKLAEQFWPGPMTLILKRSEIAKDFITGGQENVGVRVPSHPVALELLSEFEKLGGLGIAAPSANRFGAVSPTSGLDVIEDLYEYLKNKDIVIQGGNCNIGVESTIVNCTTQSLEILRHGAISEEVIRSITGIDANFKSSQSVRSSGNLERHYSPKAIVVQGITADNGDGFIAISDIKTPAGAIRLSSPKTIEEFAQNLYFALRLGDKMKLPKIVISPPNGQGLAVAIRDRINKATS